MKQKQIPMLDLRLEYKHMKKDIDAAIKKCLDHQKWIFGPEVKELEDIVAGYLGVKHCIGSSSGTEALVLSIRFYEGREKASPCSCHQTRPWLLNRPQSVFAPCMDEASSQKYGF